MAKKKPIAGEAKSKDPVEQEEVSEVSTAAPEAEAEEAVPEAEVEATIEKVESVEAKGSDIPQTSIMFSVDTDPKATPIIRLAGNGDIFVKGKLIENDKEVVAAMRTFLAKAATLND